MENIQEFKMRSENLFKIIKNSALLGISVCSLSACVTPPNYSDSVVLMEEAKSITYALEDDVKSCEKLDVVITGGAKSAKIKDAVSMAMMDARNQALAFPGNRLVYLDTEYIGYFGMSYVGIASALYSCSQPVARAAGEVSVTASVEAEAQKQAAKEAARAASLAAMQQAQMQAMMAAQHQQAMQNAQQAIQNAQRSVDAARM